MSERSIIESKIKRKGAEIQLLEKKIETAKVYLQALNDILRAISKDEEIDDGAPSVLRRGSAVARAHDTIMQAGQPVHIDDILTRMGKQVTRDSKSSLTSSLAAYVRREEIFTRPAPNTFGLIELGHFPEEDGDNGPPEGFGKLPPERATLSDDDDDEIPF